jgi:hypothetical protein
VNDYLVLLRSTQARPIASLALLTDESETWLPDHYEYSVLGCTRRLDELETDANPFAIVTAAHLRTRQTKHQPEARYQAKWTLTKMLYRQGWDRQRIIDLFKVIDWMMRLAIQACKARSTSLLVSCLSNPFSPMRSSGFLYSPSRLSISSLLMVISLLS